MMSTQVLEPTTSLVPQVSEDLIQAIETGRNRLLERAEALVINSPDTKAIGWALINGISELKKTIVEDFSSAKKASYAAWKAVCAQENGHLEKLKEPDEIVRQKLSDYETELKRQQEEADRKAREAAEIERKRLQAIADEQARVEQERLHKEAEERKIREAMEAEAAGKADVAAAILETPVEVPIVAPAPVVMVAPTVVPKVNVKVEGQGSMVEDWRYEITDANAIPRTYLLVNESAIGKVVKALKTATNIPGVRVYSVMVPRTSGRR
jgi:hypothetical protein